MSGCRVTGVGPPETPPPVLGSKKKPGLNRVNSLSYADNLTSNTNLSRLFHSAFRACLDFVSHSVIILLSNTRRVVK